jgi:hypothetical protein
MGYVASSVTDTTMTSAQNCKNRNSEALYNIKNWLVDERY